MQLSLPEQRAFRLIANNKFPTNPLIITFETRHGEIFKVRNPIRNFHDKSANVHQDENKKIEYKGSEMNQGGE
jgi:hypothetical protein